jgi:hypothetical protein
MTCASTRARLGELLTGALDAGEQASAERHVGECPECRAELAAIRGLELQLRRLGPTRRTSAFRWAAAAALLVAAGVTTLLWPSAAPSLVAGSVAVAGGRVAEGARLPRGEALTMLAPSSIRLFDGSLLRGETGARLAIDADRRVRLVAGEACFSVAKAATQFQVETPRGRIEVKGTKFTVRVGEAEMGGAKAARTAAMGVGVAVVVAAGVVVYRDYVTDDVVRIDAGMEAVAKGESVETRRLPNVETERLAADLAQARLRLADLERAVATLREAADANGASLSQILDAQERLAPILEKLESSSESAASPNRKSAGSNPAQAVADILHLDPARQAEFERTYDDVLRRLRENEARHATSVVSSDGATTTIQIGRFPEAGAALLTEWNDWVTRSLSIEEKSNYDKYKLGKNLFPRGWPRSIGEYDRTVRVQKLPTGGLSILDTGVTPDGSSYSSNSTWDDAEMGLAPYRHLMK